MMKAYDTILQSEVSAELAALNCDFAPYRYECAFCGEEVFVAAANSDCVVPHFRHRSGNNNVECELYLGQNGTINTECHLKKNNNERAEFYFKKKDKNFSIGLRFSEAEINTCEKQRAVFEMRKATQENPFRTLLINHTYFTPDVPTMINIEKFSYSYYLSNTIKGIKRKYDVFNQNSLNTPTFFKVLSCNNDYTAKLVRGKVIYTNIPYFVVYQSQYSYPCDVKLPNEIRIEDTFYFETMGRKFLGKIIVIKSKGPLINNLVTSWGYQLEASETLTLLWPPSVRIGEDMVIESDAAFFYSSFELQAYGNINVHPEDIKPISDGLTKISVNKKTRIVQKNAELVIAKACRKPFIFDEVHLSEHMANIFAVPDNGIYFIFNRSGVTSLRNGQTVLLTPKSEIRQYESGYYMKGRVIPCLKVGMSRDDLLVDILAHYKREESFKKDFFSSLILSDTASRYLEKCEKSGTINVIARYFIEDGIL